MTNSTEDTVAGKVAANIDAAGSGPSAPKLPKAADAPTPASKAPDTTQARAPTADPAAAKPDPVPAEPDVARPVEATVADKVAANAEAAGSRTAPAADRTDTPEKAPTTEGKVSSRVAENIAAATAASATETKVADKVSANIEAAGGAGGAPRAAAPTTTPLLEMRGVSKTFPGVKALNNVSLKAWGGQVLSLMGENGAGKSTLMKVLSGAYRADAGSEIYIDGQKVEMTDPRVAKALGIAIIYQELSLAPNLTVAENIYLGNEPKKGRFVDRAAMADGCQPVLERLGAPFGPKTIVSTLSIAEQQLVEIARALHANARLIVLDEPTTPLSSRETDRLFALIRQLRLEGVALIYISHRMAEVYELSDRVSVLRDGGYVGTLEKGEINADALVKMMVGRDLSTFYQKKAEPDTDFGAPMLEVRDVTDGGKRVKPCSLTVHKGEVLGIAGLVGAGRTELARLIYGADARQGGTIAIDGHAIDPRTPLDGLSAGIAYLTEDRKRLGLFLDMSCGENINIGVIHHDASKGFLNLKRAAQRAKAAFEAMRVRAASPIVQVGSLSGGNQQKVLLSRWLEIGPKVLILDEPTRGVDIGAKAEIYRIIDDLAKRGIAVIVISSEMAEIIGTCDRVVVMREGQIEGEVGGKTGRAITQENIMSYAAGVAA